MKYGTEKTTYPLDDDGSALVSIKKYRNGNVERTFRHYRIRIHVAGPKEELAEFIRFTEEIARCRQNNTLSVDKEDASTRPSFIIEYPSKDIDGSYFVIKSYTVVDIS